MQEEVLAIVTVSMSLCIQNVCVLRARLLCNHRNRSELVHSTLGYVIWECSLFVCGWVTLAISPCIGVGVAGVGVAGVGVAGVGVAGCVTQ